MSADDDSLIRDPIRSAAQRHGEALLRLFAEEKAAAAARQRPRYSVLRILFDNGSVLIDSGRILEIVSNQFTYRQRSGKVRFLTQVSRVWQGYCE